MLVGWRGFVWILKEHLLKQILSWATFPSCSNLVFCAYCVTCYVWFENNFLFLLLFACMQALSSFIGIRRLNSIGIWNLNCLFGSAWYTSLTACCFWHHKGNLILGWCYIVKSRSMYFGSFIIRVLVYPTHFDLKV